MKISIFMPCYNEEIILPHAIKHYKKYLPSAEFTIFNNYSTDNSAELAMSLGCRVVNWNTDDEIDDIRLRELKNNCWKHVDEGWVVVCDMDEWLCIDEKSLKNEDKNGATIVSTFGVDIIADSKSSVLNDINIHKESKAIQNIHMNKKICFKASEIKDINYSVGAHDCRPIGNVKFGSSYLLKHMNWLGLRYKLNLNRIRFQRSEKMRKIGLAIHYKKDDQEIISKFKNYLDKRKEIATACECFEK
jgi:glycosyltransferase involved in cell wall biosynthesis